LTGRNSDVHHPFRQDSNFQYLTGFPEPNATLFLTKNGAERNSWMVVQARNEEQEIWTGRRAGPEGAVRTYGMDRGFTVEELDMVIGQLIPDAKHVIYELGRDQDLDRQLIGAGRRHWTQPRRHKKGPDSWLDLSAFLSDLRLLKDDADQELLRRAAKAAVEGHNMGMTSVTPGMYEFQLQGVIEFGFKAHGCMGLAYNSIVAGGDNATILHYDTNQEVLKDGDLVLIDAGCEIGCMASDITRTYPINGKFNRFQAELYDLVLDAQEQALGLVTIGASLDALHKRVVEVLSQGMKDIGFFSESVEEIIEQGLYKRYYMHRTSHWLGLDVHDVGRYSQGAEPRAFEPGMAFTVEPGIYVSANDTSVPEGYRGIGIRIEDDILVTASGMENLTSDCPKTRDDIENLMKEGGLQLPTLQ